MKKCTSCKLQCDNFSKDITSKDGLQASCKTCKAKTAQKHYQKNKEKVILSSKDRKKIRRDKIKVLKENSPCKDCGIKYPYFVMHYDHLHNKSFGISWGLNFRSFALVLEEIKKCELVCANCHAFRTQRRLNNE